jgi:hypothetical protein
LLAACAICGTFSVDLRNLRLVDRKGCDNLPSSAGQAVSVMGCAAGV